MGKFTDNLRRVLNPNKQKQIDFNRSVGLNDDAKIISVDQMQNPHDKYFIRDTDNPNRYIKFKQNNYVLSDGPVMACVWDWKNGNAFINETKGQGPTLGMVRMDEVLKTQKP